MLHFYGGSIRINTVHAIHRSMRGLWPSGGHGVSVFTLGHLLVLTLQLRDEPNRCLPNLAQIHLAAREARQLVHVKKLVGAR
jgi:hypothetical protein